MPVTVSEFQGNMAHFLHLAAQEDILIMQDGEIIAKLTKPSADKASIAKSLFGVLPQNMTLEEAMEERADSL